VPSVRKAKAHFYLVASKVGSRPPRPESIGCSEEARKEGAHGFLKIGESARKALGDKPAWRDHDLRAEWKLRKCEMSRDICLDEGSMVESECSFVRNGVCWAHSESRGAYNQRGLLGLTLGLETRGRRGTSLHCHQSCRTIMVGEQTFGVIYAQAGKSDRRKPSSPSIKKALYRENTETPGRDLSRSAGGGGRQEKRTKDSWFFTRES